MSTQRITEWLKSSLGQFALDEVRKQYPNFSSNPVTHIAFTLGRYADEFTQADIDAADANELMRAAYGFTYQDAKQAERGRKGGRAATDAKAEAARRNGAKGGRPRKPSE